MKVAGGTHRGTAIPRWDWSGVDKVRVPEFLGRRLEIIDTGDVLKLSPALS